MKSKEGKAQHIPSQSFNEFEAAKHVGMSVSFLRADRLHGPRPSRTPGPRYVRVGRSIRYLKRDLNDWLENLTDGSESNAAGGVP